MKLYTSLIKKIYLLLFFVGMLSSVSAQFISNNGAVISISSGAVLSGTTLQNNSGTVSNQGTLTLSDSLANSGSIEGDGSYHVGGNWINNGIFTSGLSTVSLNGGSAQSIGGSNPTSFYNLTVNNSNGISLSQHTGVNNTLTLSSGNLDLGSKVLTLGSSASPISGSFDANHMIVADGGGELRKNYSANGSYTFPIGDNTVTAEYSPVTLDFVSGSYGIEAYAALKVTNAKHPNNASATNFLKRFWSVSQSNISSFSCNVTGTYVDADINGAESGIASAKWNGALPWVKYAAVDATNNRITANGVSSFSDFTGITLSSPTVSINGGDVTVCPSSTVTLTASVTGDPTVTYLWSTNETTSSITASTAVPGTVNYTLTITDGNGISTTSSSVFVTVNNPDDNSVCTIDACDPLTGVVSHTPINIDDSNPCTVDACNPLTGVSHTPNPVVVTVTAPPIQCFNGTTCITVSATGGSGSYVSGTGVTCGISASGLPYAYTVMDSQGCSGNGSITITEPSKVEGSTSSVAASCGLFNGSASVIPTGGTPFTTGSSYSYSWNSIPVQHTQTATGLAAGNYIVTITDSLGCSGSASVSVSTSGTLPADPGPISGPAGACKGQNGVVYSVPAGPPGTTYNWLPLPPGVTGFSTSNSITVNFLNTYAGGFICVKAVNPCGSSVNSSCINVPVVIGLPGFPGPISGRTISVCGPDTITYSIPAIPNATRYVWEVASTGSGITLVSGQGTTTVRVAVAAGFTFGTLNVYASNCIGNSSGLTAYIYGLITGQPQMVSFPSVGLCPGSTWTYSIAPYAGSVTNTWAAPTGSILSDGVSTVTSPVVLTTASNSITIKFPAGFVSGNVSVYASSGCGSGPSRTVAVRSTPTQPTSIFGPNTGVCQQTNVAYSTNLVAGATSYTWTVPAGVDTLSTGQNATQAYVLVRFNPSFVNSGNICVTPNNGCGAGITRCQNVTPRPAIPGVISGASSVCKNIAPDQTYSVTPVLGAGPSGYFWTASNGATVSAQGSATTSIKFITAGPSVTITVSAFNACGAAAAAASKVVAVSTCRTMAPELSVAAELKAYPNPTSAKLNVSFTSSFEEKYTLKVVDLIGNVMINTINTAQKGENLQEIDLSHVAKGMYLLSLERQGAETQTMRVVVE